LTTGGATNIVVTDFFFDTLNNIVEANVQMTFNSLSLSNKFIKTVFRISGTGTVTGKQKNPTLSLNNNLIEIFNPSSLPSEIEFLRLQFNNISNLNFDIKNILTIDLRGGGTLDFISMESWALTLPVYGSNNLTLILPSQEEFLRITGTNLQAILLSKNVRITK
jgi:hypothetical protein